MAKKQTSEQEPQAPATFISVTATAPLCEGSVQYKKGDVFETTPERAASLGDLVTPTPEAAE